MIGLAFNQPQIPVDGLQLYVSAADKTSYPESGVILKDLTSNSYSGTLTNGPVWSESTGDRGKFYNDGSNDNITFGDILDMGTDSITLNIWIRPDGTQTYSSWFLTKLSVAAANTNLRYGVGVLANTYRLRAQFKYTSVSTTNTTATTNMTTGIFQMASIIFDRTGSIKFYINAVEQPNDGLGNISAGAATDIQSTSPYRIGCYTNTDNVSPVGVYRGYIGEVFHYNKILSQTELTQLYNATKSKYGY
jgi:hypothetical protein